MGILITSIIAATTLAATAATAVVVLSQSIQTAQTVNSYLQIVTTELQCQTNIDNEILQRINALEAAVSFWQMAMGSMDPPAALM